MHQYGNLVVKKPGLYKGTRLHELGNGQSFCFRNSRASIKEPCCKKTLACIREHLCLHELGNGQSICFYYFFFNIIFAHVLSPLNSLFNSFFSLHILLDLLRHSSSSFVNTVSGPCFFLITTVDLAYLKRVVFGTPVNLNTSP